MVINIFIIARCRPYFFPMNRVVVDGACLHARFNAGAANLVSTVVESSSVNLVIGSTVLQEAGRWLLQLGVLGEI